MGLQNLQWKLDDQAVTSCDVSTALTVVAEYDEQPDPASTVRVDVYAAEDIDQGSSAPTDPSRSLGSAAASYGPTSLSGVWTAQTEHAGKSFYFYVTVGSDSALSPKLDVNPAASDDSQPPAFDSIDPATGDAAGGTSVTIAGSNLKNVTSVEIGGVEITDFAVNDDGTQITGTTGAHDAADDPVDVVLKGDSSGDVTGSGAFTYKAQAPTYDSIDPATGDAAGGTSVTIAGSNLKNVTSVEIGGVEITDFAVDDDGTQITGTTGAHDAADDPVDVVLKGDPSGDVTGSGAFTYTAQAPTFDSIDPTSGEAGGGTSVTIAGSNLKNVTSVEIGGVEITDFAVDDDGTQITGTTGAHDAADDPVDLVLKGDPSGDVTASGAFTYTPPAGPSNLRWDESGADPSSADPITEAAVGDSVQLSCEYGKRPDGTDPPTVAVFDAKDADSLASATPIATVTVTENDDHTGFTATWTVTPPWRKQDKPQDGSAGDSGGGGGSLPSGDSHDVTADVGSITAILARGSGGSGSNGDSGSNGGSNGSNGDSGSNGDPQQLVYSVTPGNAFDLVAKLDGFSAAPGTSQFEFYAAAPGTDSGGDPPGVIFAVTLGDNPQVVSPSLALTGAGDPPLFSLPATSTTDEATASWTYDPTDPQQVSLQLAVWIEAVADKATHTAVLSLTHASMTNLRWMASGAQDGDPQLKSLQTGQAVSLQCDVSGYNASIKPSVEIYTLSDVDQDQGQPRDGAKALATVEGSVDDGSSVLSADWTVASPPGASGDGTAPAPIPQLVFLVRIGGDHALSPAVVVTPKVRLKLVPGDPNWFMEPIVAHPVDASSAPSGGDHGRDSDRDPDAAKKKASFPHRVLGIKQRLQAIGYYYEPLPDPDQDAASLDLQTRVFKRCVGWYWKKVHPADGSDAPRKSDHGEDDKVGIPGARAIDVDKLPDEWLLDLEDRVRKLVLQQEDESATGPDVDLGKDVRLILPGDFTYTTQDANLAADPKYHIDYTGIRKDGVYAAPDGPLDNRKEGESGPDWRARFETTVFARHKGLGAFPLVARLEMQDDEGNWVPGPADGITVRFQLVATDHDFVPYLDPLVIRKVSRVSFRENGGAFGSRQEGDDAGPRGYLAEVHDHYRMKGTDPNADPTWWNAPTTQGGKRGATSSVGPRSADASILCVGSPDDVGARDATGFPWTAADGTQATPCSVTVPVQNGAAGVLFRPSRLGGDSYMVRACVDLPADVQPASGDDGSADVTSGQLTVWRRVRIARSWKLPVPDSWLQPASSAQSPDATLKDAVDDPDGAMVSPADELGGDLTELTQDHWGDVVAIFAKAFMLVEAPPDGTETLDRKLVDAATKGAAQHLRKLLTSGSKLDWNVLSRRSVGSPSNLPKAPNPDFLFELGADNPFLINFRSPAGYGKASGDHAFDDWVNTTDGTKLSPPHKGYGTALAHLFTGHIFAFLGLYLDESWRDDPTSFDPVPTPGITVVQCLYGDNISASAQPFECLELLNGFKLGSLKVQKKLPEDSTKLGDLDDGAITWSALAEGDKLTLVRTRTMDDVTASAKRPAGSGIAVVAGDAVTFDLPQWRKIEFTYGPKSKGFDGQTFTELSDKLEAHVKDICRDPKKPDVTYQYVRKWVVVSSDGSWSHLVFTFQYQALEAKWKYDGFSLWLLRSKKNPDGSFSLADVASLEGPWGSFDHLAPPGRASPYFSTSGLAECARTLFLHYGGDVYSSTNFSGPDPRANPPADKPRGVGYRPAGNLFSYDVATNLAHELGHMLYLRHQFTKDSYPREGLLDHDFDDFCHMGYFTGFVQEGSSVATSVAKDDIEKGVGRDRGRAEPCGRCLLKLRGWAMDMDDLPPNVPVPPPPPPPAPATGGDGGGAGGGGGGGGP